MPNLRYKRRWLCALVTCVLGFMISARARGQYPGSTPSAISFSMANATATNYQQATGAAVQAGTNLSGYVSFTLGKGGTIYPPAGGGPLNCNARGEGGGAPSDTMLFTNYFNGSASASFLWVPTAGQYEIVCSGGSGAFWVQTEPLYLTVTK
jgi:hypothetical protein